MKELLLYEDMLMSPNGLKGVSALLPISTAPHSGMIRGDRS